MHIASEQSSTSLLCNHQELVQRITFFSRFSKNILYQISHQNKRGFDCALMKPCYSEALFVRMERDSNPCWNNGPPTFFIPTFSCFTSLLSPMAFSIWVKMRRVSPPRLYVLPSYSCALVQQPDPTTFSLVTLGRVLSLLTFRMGITESPIYLNSAEEISEKMYATCFAWCLAQNLYK